MTKLETLFKKYDNIYYKNSDLTEENFPTPKVTQTKNWKIIKMTKSFSSQEALDEIKKQGCRPANLYELLEWAKDNQEKNQWVIALGQIWTDAVGNHMVPYVYRDSDGDFGFSLGIFEDDWSDDYCLLCFCDESTQALSTSETQPSDSLTLESAIKICKEAGLTVTKTY